ncbi:MAG: hypothetical protein IKU37_00145 [Candidatus Gastranaerophilales bacterium]|nr:hypothetical protein [Candidatus Gastranaerophilales bacterium]
MDVNQVRFGNYSIGNPQNGTPKKNEEKASETQTQNQQQTLSSLNPNEVMNALGLAGMQNLAFISKSEAKEVNPTDYLDEGRISDIEAMMAEFEAGVGQVAQTIEAEFPDMFAPDQLNALAAKVFAAE